MLSVACIHLYLLHDGQAKCFICVNKYFNGFQKNWTKSETFACGFERTKSVNHVKRFMCMCAGLCCVFNEFLKETERENTALRPSVCRTNCNLQYNLIYNTLNFTCYRLSECKPPLHGSDPFFIPRHCTITKQVKYFSNSI